MAKQLQLNSLSVSIDSLQLTPVLLNVCDWCSEQLEYHQVHTYEAKVFLPAHSAEYAATLYLPRCGVLVSVSLVTETIPAWILMALLSGDVLKYQCAFTSQALVHAFCHQGKQKEE
jgi:hypothetical protein